MFRVCGFVRSEYGTGAGMADQSGEVQRPKDEE